MLRLEKINGKNVWDILQLEVSDEQKLSCGSSYSCNVGFYDSSPFPAICCFPKKGSGLCHLSGKSIASGYYRNACGVLPEKYNCADTALRDAGADCRRCNHHFAGQNKEISA